MNAPVDGVNQIADAWWFWTLHAAWQSAVIGCVVLAVVAWGRRWPSTARSWLLVIALLKFAVPPLWSAPTGLFSRIAIGERPAATAPAAAKAITRPLTFETGPIASRTGDFKQRHDRRTQNDSQAPPAKSANRDRTEFATNAGSGERFDQTAPPAAVPAAASRVDLTEALVPSLSGLEPRSLSWKSLLLALHLLGTIGILVWVAVQFRSVWRIVARSRSVESGPVAESLGRIRVRLGMRGTARVLLSPDVASPLAVGALRPTVVLPESAQELPPRELDAVLIHELTHLRRGDAWLAWAQVLLCAAWWFHPVIWLVNRSLRRVREDCCDDAILLSGVATGSEYCEILLRVARNATARRVDWLACHMGGRLHPLGDRIRRIMDARVRRWRRTPVAAWPAVVVLASIALPGLGQPVESPPNNAAQDSGTSEKAATSPGAAVRQESDRFARRVREAIVRGRKSLVAMQNGDGSFSDDDAPIESTVIIPTSDTGVPKVMEINVRATPAYPLATTSLAVLALLDSGMKHDEPVIVKSLDFLRSSPEPRLSVRTYENSLTVVALVAARQWDRDRARIAAIARSLEDHQILKGAHAGMWNATQRDVPGDEDNSNTQYAVWGLREAAVAGVPIKRETWERAAVHFVKYQNHDGGWGTRNSGNSTGSMTCAAVASLFLCDQMLARTKRGDAARVPQGGDEQASARDRAIKQGIDWLSRYFTVGINPGEGSGGFLHYINGLARIGRLSGRQFLGKRDWYREEAAILLDGQTYWDGSWQGMGAEANKPVATSLALLFLCEHK